MSDGEFKPGVAAIIIIAIGILIFSLLFIFAKRQIMRFAQKFPVTDGPNVPIAHDAPKRLRQTIERRLNGIKNIQFEPWLLNPDNEYACEANAHKSKHIYRMKAVDMAKELEEYILNAYGRNESKKRQPGQDLRDYLHSLRRETGGGPLANCDMKLIDDFVDSYLHARCDPEEFGHDEWEHHRLLGERLKSQIVPFPAQSATTPIKTTNKKTARGIVGNLSFRNLSSLSLGGGGKDVGPKKIDETSV